MASRIVGAVAATALAATLAGMQPAAAQVMGLGTGKQGFFTYSAGAALAKVASDNGLPLRIQPFGGTSAYVPAISAGEVEFGLANELETNYAVTGTVIYKGKPQPNVRAVAILTPLYNGLFVKKDSPIRKVSDLKGKRLPSDYVSQKILQIIVSAALANGGLTWSDVVKVPVPNVVGGANEFAQGKADAFNFALGAGAVAETDAKVGGIRAIPADNSPEAMARTRKFLPVAYATVVQPGHGRAGVTEPTMVLAYDYMVLANKDVSDEKAYKLAKAMHDHADALKAGFAGLSEFDPARMAKDMGPVQFHPGAIKFYKEIGAWPPKG